MALALEFHGPPQQRRVGRRNSLDNGLAPAADMLKLCAARRPECAGVLLALSSVHHFFCKDDIGISTSVLPYGKVSCVRLFERCGQQWVWGAG